jgi:hypothetical protein
MTDPNPYRRPGTANRTITDAPQVDSQDVSRFKAVDLVPDLDRRIDWRAVFATAWPFCAMGVWLVAGALWTGLPWWVQAVCIASTPCVAIGVVWQQWAGRVR